MVIGAQQMPFKTHAWVEVDGRVVNDKHVPAGSVRSLGSMLTNDQVESGQRQIHERPVWKMEFRRASRLPSDYIEKVGAALAPYGPGQR